MHEGQDYREGLSAEELVSTLQGLLGAEQRAKQLTCRYLADFADRMEGRAGAGGGAPAGGVGGALAGYADIYHAARCLFGLGAHTTRERIRVGRALRALPRIEEAFVSRELSYSRTREVTRVATASDESAWLLLGRELPIRALERRVAEAAGKSPKVRAPDAAHVRIRRSETVEVTLQLPAGTWALVQRAMEGARRASVASLCDAEALEAIARDALARQCTDVKGADLRRAVVPHECQSCARTELDAGGGPVEVGAGAAAALGCGARERDLRTKGRALQRGGPSPAAIEQAVRLQGDAKGDLSFHDETGAPLGLPAVSHSGTSALSGAPVDGSSARAASHGGTSALSKAPVDGRSGRAPSHGGTSALSGGAAADRSARAASHGGTAGALGGANCGSPTLLALLGQGGRWSVDALIEASGLGVGEVACALLQLEIEGRIEGAWGGDYRMCMGEA
ncbi:MAG: hypothetical protein R3B70_32055 [Polyangiaceae bacterium]